MYACQLTESFRMSHFERNDLDPESSDGKGKTTENNHPTPLRAFSIRSIQKLAEPSVANLKSSSPKSWPFTIIYRNVVVRCGEVVIIQPDSMPGKRYMEKCPGVGRGQKQRIFSAGFWPLAKLKMNRSFSGKSGSSLQNPHSSR